MTPDLKKFRGQSTPSIINSLLADGYMAINPSNLHCQIFRDSAATHLIRLSPKPCLSAAFAKACLLEKENGFLPKIHSHMTLNTDLHATVTENLRCIEEIEEGRKITVFGHARAVSSFLAGDEMHMHVHKCMSHDPQLLGAARTIASVAMKAFKSVPETAINPSGDSIWFRVNDAGCQTVYANPYFLTKDKTAQECRNDLQWITKRLTETERMAPMSAYWRDTHPVAKP